MDGIVVEGHGSGKDACPFQGRANGCRAGRFVGAFAGVLSLPLNLGKFCSLKEMVEESKGGNGESSKQDSSFFWRAILLEGSLLGIAWLLAWCLGVPLFADFQWEAKSAWIGLVSVFPMLAFLGWILRSEHPLFAEIRDCCDSLVRQCFGKESWFSIALLSAIAGVGEEVLFRAVLQGGLSVHTAPAVGVLAASFLFASCHALTKGYFAAAFCIGIYLSVVWQTAGNLLAPIIAHGVYDFLALWCFLRRAKNHETSAEETESDS